LKLVTFKEKKKNHIYAEKDDKGNLSLIQEPVMGQEYYEIAAISGGSDAQRLLEVPVGLCEKHLKASPEKFAVETCRGWTYIAIPVSCGSCSCLECKSQLSSPQPVLTDANLSYANLRGADLSYANLIDANLRDANLRDANLRGANLRGANLRGADLSYANLRGADLSYANLRGADLSYANLRGANLIDANLTDAKYNKYTQGLSDEQKKVMVLIE